MPWAPSQLPWRYEAAVPSVTAPLSRALAPAGYFKNARLLVRPKTEGSPWRLLDDAFPDSKTAFLPAEALAAAEELGAEPEAIGNILEEVDENQLLPEELKAHEKNMVRYFEQGDNWFFIDAEGETQGPFPGA